MEQVHRKRPAMERKKTMTMNWDGLGDDDDDDRFFESYSSRLSSAVPLDLLSSGSDDDEEFEDSRLSFSSAVSTDSFRRPATRITDRDDFIVPAPLPMFGDYDMWTSEPGNVQERRKRLLHGMGLCSNKNLLKSVSTKLAHAVSKKMVHVHDDVKPPVKPPPVKPPPVEPELQKHDPSKADKPESTTNLPLAPIVLVRSRSDGDIEAHSAHTRRRKEEIIGTISKQRLTRTSSLLITPKIVVSTHVAGSVRSPKRNRENRGNRSSVSGSTDFQSSIDLAAFILIKNLDTGKEFVVKEYNKNGLWNRFSDIQTGKQLSMEEFEKSVGYSPVVKELMRRQSVTADMDDPRKIGGSSYFSKSLRYSKRRGVSLLKNIKGTMGSSKFNDKDSSPPRSNSDDHHSNKNQSSHWVKVRSQGKSLKEFTALHICQEIQAHEGSIWTIKFSLDGHYLASAGEDRVIHVWEVQECEVMFSKSFDDSSAGANCSPIHPSMERPPSFTESERKKDKHHMAELSRMSSEKKKKWKKKGNSIPHYVHVPENMFSLSDKPVCSFTGHLDDVLDLSWSKSQLLLSSSMDKTVRLWDLETKSCLKTFSHNDYVTCIQFNPNDEDYFISGSLDEKVRIWSIPDRKLADYSDLHEMVTAVRYTPDSQGALIGTHKGVCRLYTISDCSFEQTSQIELSRKKKPQAKKITGFEFAPDNPHEVLITSADSRIRIANVSEITHKFKGFKNTSSQISASFSHDGMYVISASEDSQVYIWRRGSSGKGKGIVTINAHERFPCKDVSVAIPWSGSMRNEPPVVEIHSKRHSRKSVSHPPSNSPKREDNLTSTHSKRELPPLPKKATSPLERSSSCQEDQHDASQICRSNSGMGESFSSISSSCRFGESPSMSGSSSLDGGTNGHGGHHTIQATAWGLVIVTASLGGEIRAYQNLGLPRKVGRQTNLFKDPT